MINSGTKIRRAAWAGQFYPGNPENLKRMIDQYLDSAPMLDVGGRIIGLVSPHAGYQYSGATAAAGYKQLMDVDFTHVIVIAPSHAELFPGVSIYDGDYYETPLGLIPVDKKLAADIASHGDMLRLSELGHRTSTDRAEHSLEVQLPFLQRVAANDFKLVPMVFHDYSVAICRQLANAIVESIGDKKVVIVASSDLYHGYSYDECLETDRRTVQGITSMDGEEFCLYANKGIYQACGAGPIAVLLMVGESLGADRAIVVDQTNSADVTGAIGGWTVGYASVLVVKEGK